ncbi:MAG: hypothetical protein H6Q68_2277 [Firmicutes bacterium]|nr:hypothetical protein [Bacillota bacterium]
MECIPISTIVIDNDTGVTLLNEEDMSLSLPDHDEIQALKGSSISIANKEYTIVEATTEPKLNDDCDIIGTYVFLNVAKKA